MSTHLIHEDFFNQLDNDMKNLCAKCNKECPCKRLSNYIREVGIEEFKKQHYSFSLPKDIQDAFWYYYNLIDDSYDL